MPEEVSSLQRWTAEVEIAVQFYDLDPMAVVWHGNYARFLEVARSALLDAIGYNYREMRDSGYAWPIVDMHVRFAHEITLGQRIRVRATLCEWENRLKIDYLILDAATGRRLSRASTVQVAVEMETGTMCYVSPPVLGTKLGMSA